MNSISVKVIRHDRLEGNHLVFNAHVPMENVPEKLFDLITWDLSVPGPP